MTKYFHIFYLCKKIVDTWATFKMKVYKGINGGNVVQRFIHTTSNIPRITRVVYYNPMYQKKPTKVNFAWAIVNELKIDIEQGNYHYKWCVNMEIPNSIRVEKIVGKAVSEYMPYMKSILNFILKACNLRLKTIVADFIKDKNGEIWFVDLKSFKVPKIFYSVYLESPGKIETKLKKDMTKTSAKCRLCNMKYSKEELHQLLTMNMIIEYKKHLNERGIFAFEHVDVFF